ncbi:MULTISPECIES: hypothetical protein [Paenibacillus]|uniref:hypothetical protein n=1 Tax=Paenibacillus TaxID=44249 RepID=UPI00097020A3|nr:hypothetical protein [Paenibacillus odorifer]OME21597.1 hypothetical protein BSK57_19825 [Paenibacillus odorifer]
MKKFISGIIVGVLLFTGASAFADSVGLIGQKVQGIFTVEKGGKKVADAIIINGTAYAPVRAVSEATGAILTVEGKKIIMGDVVVGGVLPSSDVSVSSELSTKRDEVVAEIEKKAQQIANHKELRIKVWETFIKENPNSTTIPQWQASLDEANTQLVQFEKELAFYQAELAQINAALGE